MTKRIINAGLLSLITNILKRDAANNMTVRGEIVTEIENTVITVEDKQIFSLEDISKMNNWKCVDCHKSFLSAYNTRCSAEKIDNVHTFAD